MPYKTTAARLPLVTKTTIINHAKTTMIDSILDFFFGSKPAPKEIARDNKLIALAAEAQQKLEAHRALHGIQDVAEWDWEMDKAIREYENRGGGDRRFMNVIDDHGIKLWRFNVEGQVRVFTKEALLHKNANR
jgi:hypothetical protein